MPALCTLIRNFVGLETDCLRWKDTSLRTSRYARACSPASWREPPPQPVATSAAHAPNAAAAMSPLLRTVGGRYQWLTCAGYGLAGRGRGASGGVAGAHR